LLGFVGSLLLEGLLALLDQHTGVNHLAERRLCPTGGCRQQQQECQPQL